MFTYSVQSDLFITFQTKTYREQSIYVDPHTGPQSTCVCSIIARSILLTLDDSIYDVLPGSRSSRASSTTSAETGKLI